MGLFVGRKSLGNLVQIKIFKNYSFYLGSEKAVQSSSFTEVLVIFSPI